MSEMDEKLNTLLSDPGSMARISWALLQLLRIRAPPSFSPAVTSTDSIRDSSTTTT